MTHKGWMKVLDLTPDTPSQFLNETSTMMPRQTSLELTCYEYDYGVTIAGAESWRESAGKT